MTSDMAKRIFAASVRWLTAPYWSRLDGAVMVVLAWLIGSHPQSVTTKAVLLVVLMVGVRPLSAALAWLGRKAGPATPPEEVSP